MGKFIVGIILGLPMIPLAFAVYVLSGRVPVAASDPPMPFETYLARGGLEARIHREAPDRDVSGFTTTQLIAGANVYQKDCAFCHGLPEASPQPIGRDMFPRAPQFFARKRPGRDPAGENYWKIVNGIRLTGMPGFKASLSDEQIWQVTALVSRIPQVSPEALDVLKPPAQPAPSPASEKKTGGAGHRVSK